MRTSLRPNLRPLAWGWVGALIGLLALGVPAYWIVRDDLGHGVHHITSYDRGPAGFIGIFMWLGMVTGFVIARRIAQGQTLTRSGYTLAYAPIGPRAVGYRELETLAVADLLRPLRAVGYQPAVQPCTDDGARRRGAVDERAPLAGANLALVDPRVRGWIRVHLPVPAEGATRAVGLIEVWRHRGPGAEELALYTQRALDELLVNLTASLEDSQLAGNPVKLLTASLGERPAFRA